MPKIPSKLKAPRNRIRRHARKPAPRRQRPPRRRRLQARSNPDGTGIQWVRDRFLEGPTTSGAISWIELTEKLKPTCRGLRLRDRFRILRWIFRLLRR